MLDDNIPRLLKTFEDAMADAGTKLAKSNETEVSRYIGQISEKFREISDHMGDKLGQSFDYSIERFGGTLSGFVGDMTEKNRDSLKEVQYENNAELQRLTELLAQLTEKNTELAVSSSRSGEILSDNLNRLIENSENLGDTIRSHIADGTEQTEQAIQRQIDRMLEKNAEHDRENADAYKKAMEDYRQEFVKASAAAIAEVQSDMISRMEETQRQMASLAETMGSYMKIVKEHEIAVQQENAELKMILLDHSAKMSQGTTDALDKMAQVLDKLSEKINENNTNITNSIKANNEYISLGIDEIKTNTEESIEAIKTNVIPDCSNEINKTVSDALNEYNKKLTRLSDSIGEVLELFKKIDKHIEENTKKYDSTLKTITENQKHTQELSRDDVRLLQEMMKKI